MALSIPTIHLNGTSRESLASDLRNALHALEAAARALQHTCPNERDYYPQGQGAITAAMRQHTGRMGKLYDVRQELSAIAEAIA
jgi:hypothetical protein